ncbi:MAG: hypothetical protein LC800_00130 [Acidobacteria bacterium]|nr:hypothetical protein [Acidobacteriota bacterium]
MKNTFALVLLTLLVCAEGAAQDNPVAVPACTGVNCQTLQLQLLQELPVGQTFILAISEFRSAAPPVTMRFAVSPPPPEPAKAKITAGPDVFATTSGLQIRSDEELRVAGPLTVRRVYYVVAPDGLSFVKMDDSYVASVSPGGPSKRFVLELDRKLVQGKEHLLEIHGGITNLLGQPVKAEGTVKIAGIPTKAEELRYDINLASNVAVHQRPIFELAAKVNPYNPKIHPKPVFGTEWLWEPSASVDLGLRSTKSKNSVVLTPLNFSREFFRSSLSTYKSGTAPSMGTATATAAAPSPSPSPKPGAGYANWLSTPWYRLGNVKFTGGPKAEFDRNFRRKNVLGTLRFDFNFHRWDASIGSRRKMINNAFRLVDENVGPQARLNFGFSLVPFMMLDFGGHVNNETVSKKVKGTEFSVFVPRHKILRSYLGFNSTTEFNDLPFPLTLEIEESLVHLGTSELIGFTTDDGAFLKQLRGFHHQGKAKFSFAIDRSKHYSLTLTYENGRWAPNLEYLNKLSTGIRIAY